jgi:hypothetical protein
MQAFLLFSHQLYPDVVRQPRTSVMYLIEDARLFREGANPSLAIFHRAALQAVRERLLVKGFAVRYLGADEFPSLEYGFALIAKEHPEVVRFYELGDKQLKEQLESLLAKNTTPFLELSSPTIRVNMKPRKKFIPHILPPIEPNRYVEEAARYFLKLVPTDAEIEFAYPVTKGDTEEWLELLPDIVRSGTNLSELAQDIAPLLRAGLLDITALEADLHKRDVPLEQRRAFRLLLTS